MKAVVVSFLFFALSQIVFADLPVAPYAKASVSPNGTFVMVAAPIYSDGSGAGAAKNTMFELGRDGSLSEIWHAKVKYSLETYVSDDGVHFVQVESTVFGQKPEATDVGLRFYSRGELIASYSPLQFLNAKAQLKKSISHYYWLDTDDKCHAVVLSNQFVLTTIDKTEHCFDMSTGKELKK